MPRKISLFVYTLSAALSLPVFAAAPFSRQELKTMQGYMYANFATQEKMFVKNDNGKMIQSMPGAILASPSLQNGNFSQDYQFHWTRDAGITIRETFNEFLQKQNQDEFKLDAKLRNYINFERIAQQQLSNPGEETLGQPKFNMDSTIWEGVWGRPQNDGPAIRALALCEMGRTNMEMMREVLPLIKTDLDYLVREWHKPNYDLWEEVKDTDHFFTKMMQHRAFVCGANLLYFVDALRSRQYTATANSINETLNKHWHEELGYATETIDQLNYKGGGLNSAVILAVLYGKDLSEASYLPEWSVRDDRVMSTVTSLRDAFFKEYPINKAHPELPPLIGRYPGDIYDGGAFVQGNPWVLTSAALAEYYYSLAYVYKHLYLPIEISMRNLKFFYQIGLQPHFGDSYQPGSAKFNEYVAALVKEGDRYLERIKQHQACETNHDCLHYAEQIDAKTGKQTSAKDLTWGYVSIQRAMRVRGMV